MNNPPTKLSNFRLPEEYHNRFRAGCKKEKRPLVTVFMDMIDRRFPKKKGAK